MAIEQWRKLRDGECSSLERALSAFDMFVLDDAVGDFNEVCNSFESTKTFETKTSFLLFRSLMPWMSLHGILNAIILTSKL